MCDTGRASRACLTEFAIGDATHVLHKSILSHLFFRNYLKIICRTLNVLLNQMV